MQRDWQHDDQQTWQVHPGKNAMLELESSAPSIRYRQLLTDAQATDPRDRESRIMKQEPRESRAHRFKTSASHSISRYREDSLTGSLPGWPETAHYACILPTVGRTCLEAICLHSGGCSRAVFRIADRSIINLA